MQFLSFKQINLVVVFIPIWKFIVSFSYIYIVQKFRGFAHCTAWT